MLLHVGAGSGALCMGLAYPPLRMSLLTTTSMRASVVQAVRTALNASTLHGVSRCLPKVSGAAAL